MNSLVVHIELSYSGTMKKGAFFPTVFMLLLMPAILSAQKYLLTDNPNYFRSNEMINHSYYQVGMINDFNPFFNKHCKDDGYTLGLYFDSRIKTSNSYDYFDIKYVSDLYTKYLNDLAYKAGTRIIRPQYFNEISFLSLEYKHLIKSGNIYLSIGAGYGVNNRERPIWGLSLYVQGGEDGKGGYHSLIKNPGQDNIPTGNIQPLYFICPSLIKYYSLISSNTGKTKASLEFQAGYRFGTVNLGSGFFLRSYALIPLIRTYKYHDIFSFSFIAGNELKYSIDGIVNAPEWGVETKILFLSVGFTSIFYKGEQNITALKYFQNVPHMNGYIRINF
jgi:hypothetical protein